MCIDCFSITASAIVIAPEVVKTEKWTTSYYIDDDMDTLYPYIQCEADIYNDGTIMLYMWNTHEWDGFATVQHTVNLPHPFADVSAVADDSAFTVDSLGDSVSYYDVDYVCRLNGFFNCFRGSNNWWMYNYYYKTALPLLNSFQCRPERASECVIKAEFYPKVDPTGIYNFRLFGHNITITPELLSGNIVAEPELTDQEKRINALEEKVSNLEKQLEAYQAFDFDSDNLLTAADAQMILTYYVEYLAGVNDGSVSGYADFVKSGGK